MQKEITRILYYGTAISAIVPATFIFIVSLFIVMSHAGSFPSNREESFLLAQGVLGIFGYFGLVMLFTENKGERRRVILVLLALNVTSFLFFIGPKGKKAVNLFTTIEGLIFFWPFIVSAFHMYLLVKQPSCISNE
ncbi:hypothetical protein ACFSC6_07795 [Rufibacter sediminis]|uniref:DUF4345 domain-containing protein n=1 Tax=Rufibacter sediminis TaxID=2762756 RepID=A0ABR6VQT1_9BACT|nr:hypothetical protein [Rufibacter sediminis]MBC3539244.1 hypothetical protein [Rufibacter sediminis]